MIDYDRNKWWVLAFAYKATVIRQMAVRISLFLVLTAVLAVLQYYKYQIPDTGATLHTLLGTALGLLLVFRTNASYGRYWEGRKLLGAIVNNSRDLMRAASCYCKLSGSDGPAALVQYIAGFVIGLKLRLRDNKDTTEVAAVVKSPSAREKITKFHNPALASLNMISVWIEARAQEGNLERWHARTIESYLAQLCESQGGLERICNTPIPFAYAVHTHQFLLLYLVTLPFTMVVTYEFYSLVAVFIISFGLLGIDEAGVEIEDPFGLDDNDLPLEIIFNNIVRDAQALVDLNSGVQDGVQDSGEGTPSVRVQVDDEGDL